MKNRLLITSSLAVLLGLGVAGGLSLAKKDAKAVEAATITSRLVVKLGNISKWSQSSAKLCACLTDDTNTYWTSLQTMSSSVSIYAFDYTVSFTPTKLIWVRMNSAATSGNWSQKWNQTGDLSLADATYLQDQWDPTTAQCSQWEIAGDVYTSKNSFASPKVTFDVSSVELVESSKDPQVAGVVTLEVNEEFKVVNRADNTWSGYYGCPAALDSCFTGGSKTKVEGSSNIKCLVAGTYDFYFNTETKKIWISRQDIVDADGWASYFLNNVNCDATGATKPTGWSACATEYNKLNSAAKNYVYNGTADPEGDNLGRALARYDVAVANHSDLTRFIVDGSGHIRSASVHFSPVVSFNNTNLQTTVIIVIASVLAVAGVGGYFFIRRKKEQ